MAGWHRNMARVTILLAFGLGVGLLPAQAFGSEHWFSALSILHYPKPRIAPNFTLKDDTGKIFRLQEYRGKIVFLNFWATWCPPCRKEMPTMEQLYQTFKEEDFVMLAVNLFETPEQVGQFRQEFQLSFPLPIDPDGSIVAFYGVRGIPTTFLIDRQGKIVAQAVGERNWGSPEAQELIQALLAQPGS